MLKSPTIRRRPVERFGPAGHAFDEIELLAELGVLRAVGDVAAGGDIDVLEHHALAGPEQLDPDMARLAVVLPVVPAENSLQRDAADRGDPVIALLPVDRLVDVAQVGERLVPGSLLGRLLISCRHSTSGASSVRKRSTLRHAQAHRIDVPGGDLDHGRRIRWLWRRGTQLRARIQINPSSGGIGTRVHLERSSRLCKAAFAEARATGGNPPLSRLG